MRVLTEDTLSLLCKYMLCCQSGNDLKILKQIRKSIIRLKQTATPTPLSSKKMDHTGAVLTKSTQLTNGHKLHLNIVHIR